MLSKQYGCCILLLFSLYTNHDDRPICLNTMRCALRLPPPLYNCVTVDMLFNIVGYRIDGNNYYESWKYMGRKTARDRLAPGRGPSFPHPVLRRFFGAVQIMHIKNIVFIFHIFIKKTC